MSKLAKMWLGLVLALASAGAPAQTAVQTSGTTSAGTVPVFGPTSNTTVTNSPISVSGSNVGIGTTAPNGLLDVKGPSVDFVVSGRNLDPSINYPLTFLENSGSLLEGWNRSAGGGETDFIANRGPGGPGGFNFYDYTNSGSLNLLVTFTGGGYVGIGTTAVPAYPLDVAGQIRSSSGGIVFPDGSTQTTAYSQIASGSNVITQNNGNVSIGSATSTSPLIVYGSSLGTTNGDTANLLSLVNSDT